MEEHKNTGNASSAIKEIQINHNNMRSPDSACQAIGEQDNQKLMLFSFKPFEEEEDTSGAKSKKGASGLRINHQRGSAELSRL